ncbi:serine/threonine protein kinase [Kribbella voronezhensis]|uniref:non-specific serine/threonine protein kinase n=1 Tax=Kribbella voronezhensis TaxID=2512212 RepID=A0A4R7T7X0_9ACTN|nr:serine/threonine-protein kinase [Kribbella voronezhensis]TDU88032.1 serine/threonine protein kinase [Kribbella voronezhensis]
MRVADRYELEAVIGQGGMGQVWRATDAVLGRPVAVKLLKQGRTGREAAAMFRREAQAAAVVNSPHVVGVHDFGPHNQSFYLVMELVVGNTLAAALQQFGPFSPPAAAEVVGQTADGLSAAHDQGVIHRDIKPSNLLMADDGTIKIADFGIACFLNHSAEDQVPQQGVLGTSYYLAPERARAEPVGPAADIYSLGCVLYQLLTGAPPFLADTPTGVLRQHLVGVPARPARVGSGFGRQLLRMLAKDPADRPDADEVAAWCRRISADHPAHPPADAELFAGPTTQLQTVSSRYERTSACQLSLKETV